MNNHLTILMKNGELFFVKGKSIDDVPYSFTNRYGWSSFELLNGKSLQIWTEEVSAIYESGKEGV